MEKIVNRHGQTMCPSFLPLCKRNLVSSLITLLLALPRKADLPSFWPLWRLNSTKKKKLKQKDPNQIKKKIKTHTITQYPLDISEAKVCFSEWVHFGEREAYKMSQLNTEFSQTFLSVFTEEVVITWFCLIIKKTYWNIIFSLCMHSLFLFLCHHEGWHNVLKLYLIRIEIVSVLEKTVLNFCFPLIA